MHARKQRLTASEGPGPPLLGLRVALGGGTCCAGLPVRRSGVHTAADSWRLFPGWGLVRANRWGEVGEVGEVGDDDP
jgi:hypothetical protein